MASAPAPEPTGDPPVVLPADAPEDLRRAELALRAATTPNPVRLDGIIVITEPRRALGSRDVAATLNAPVIAEVPRDATISRAVDAGLLRSRYPQAAAPILPVLTYHLRVSGRPDPRL